jgi:ribose transport system ATP-binding protein
MALVPGDRHRAGSVTSLSVRENLSLTDLGRHSTRLAALRRRAERAEVRRWITSLDIRPADPDAPFMSLSGGNQQKVVLAKWLRMQPRVLLLDEPTQGVDVHAKAIIHRLAREAATAGTAVVIASSDDAELCDTCDRVIVVRDGRIAGELRGEQITARELGRLQLAG